jgi:hypothetical protein
MANAPFRAAVAGYGRADAVEEEGKEAGEPGSIRPKYILKY